jgi:hypothetical protein
MQWFFNLRQDRDEEWMAIRYGGDGGARQRELKWAIAMSDMLNAWLDSQVKGFAFERYQRYQRESRYGMASCIFTVLRAYLVVLQPLSVCDRAHDWLVIRYG